MKRKHDVLPVLLTTLGIILGAGGLWLIRSMGPDFNPISYAAHEVYDGTVEISKED